MPFYDDSDPNLPPGSGEFEKFPDGTYQIVGIDEYAKKYTDDQGLPYFRLVNDEMRVALILKMEGQAGPPYSCGAVHLVALAQAFGVNIADLSEDRNSSRFLLKVKELINATGKKITVEVKGGWVSRIPAAQPPSGMDGIFQFEFVKFYSTDGSVPAQFTQDGYDNYKVGALYEIVAAQDGGPTPWAGFPIKEPMYNPFDGVYSDDGARVPKMKKNKDSSRPSSVSRFYAFCAAFTDWERLQEHAWSAEELTNPLLAVQSYLVPHRRVLGQLELTQARNGVGSRLKLDLLKVKALGVVNNIKPVSSGPVAKAPEAPVVEAVAPVDVTPDFSENHPHLKALVRFLSSEANSTVKGVIFTEDMVLTTDGQAWAKEKLADHWVACGMPAHRKFALLTEEEAKTFYDYLIAADVFPVPF